MRVLPDSPRLPGRRSIPRSERGVGLVELMVVVTIISMLMALAVPSYQRVQKKARAGALVNDMRVFSTVFLAYAHENGVWPAETAAGVVPTGITSQDMKTDTWINPTPIGGKFDWEYNQIHQGVKYRAAIAITDTADSSLIIDTELFQLMDEALDDGNLNTGSFRLGENNCPLYILEQ
jgi:prepilin-type N-terminal cleavage/methylation domain-containing protein